MRLVKAVHGRRPIAPDPPHEIGLAEELRSRLGREGLLELYCRFAAGEGYVDALMRRICVRALAQRCGDGLSVGLNVGLRHPETFEIGSGVFIGEQAILQGRFDGRCSIGDGTWIGPQSFLDARDLMLGCHVGWGPGARVLGSTHTGRPADVPIVQTDLQIAPVRVEDWADIGVGAVLLPGVTVGRGSIVGAGAVVTGDVPAFAKVAGVPARIIGWREGCGPTAADAEETKQERRPQAR